MCSLTGYINQFIKYGYACNSKYVVSIEPALFLLLVVFLTKLISALQFILYNSNLVHTHE